MNTGASFSSVLNFIFLQSTAGHKPLVVQAPEIAKQSPSSISASLRVTGGFTHAFLGTATLEFPHRHFNPIIEKYNQVTSTQKILLNILF